MVISRHVVGGGLSDCLVSPTALIYQKSNHQFPQLAKKGKNHLRHIQRTPTQSRWSTDAWIGLASEPIDAIFGVLDRQWAGLKMPASRLARPPAQNADRSHFVTHSKDNHPMEGPRNKRSLRQLLSGISCCHPRERLTQSLRESRTTRISHKPPRTHREAFYANVFLRGTDQLLGLKYNFQMTSRHLPCSCMRDLDRCESA